VVSSKQLVADFRRELEEFAKANNLEITKIPGWTDEKLSQMALAERRCCCQPDKRRCPCKAGLAETRHNKDAMCLCSIFIRKGVKYDAEEYAGRRK